MKPNGATMTAAIAIVALVTGCASSDSRLLGRWQSNRSLTIATFPHRKQLPAAKRAFFDGMFGRLTLNYTRRYIYSELPPKETEPPFRQRIPYRVLASDADSVTIATNDTSSPDDSTKQIHFIGPNRYWIPLGTKGGREYFDRLNQ
jgi:hypothetical protein